MKKILEKFDIRIKLLCFFFLLIILPYISLICIAYSKLEDYAGNNSGRTMEDTMISISSQVHSAIEMYGDNSTGLYYNGCVEMFENGSATREYIEYALGAVSYPYKDIRFTYLKSGDQEYCNGLIQYSDLNKAMEPYYQEIVDAGGRPKWYAIDDLYGRYQRKMFVMGRILNGKKQKNIGVLYYVLSEHMVSDALKKLQMEECEKYMIDEDGELLYSSSGQLLDEQAIRIVTDSVEQSGYQVITVAEEKCIVAYSKVRNTDWAFIGCVPLKVLIKSILPLKKIIIGISVFYCLFLFMVYYLFQKQFLKPISVLKKCMDQFAAGNMTVRMDEPKAGELKSLFRHFNSMTLRINELVIRNNKEITEKNSFKYQALCAQLRPHFIYNSLNTIKWLAVINKQENIQKLTEALIYILMNAIGGEKENYTVRQEIKLVEQYVVIQKARFLNFNIIFDIEEDTKDCRVFQFLIQTAVENAIIHGFRRGMAQGGKIIVAVKKKEDCLSIIVEDNGCGFDVNTWRKCGGAGSDHTNIGLKNIEQMIQLEYGKEYYMTVDSVLGEGTKVMYKLPFIKES